MTYNLSHTECISWNVEQVSELELLLPQRLEGQTTLVQTRQRHDGT